MTFKLFKSLFIILLSSILLNSQPVDREMVVTHQYLNLPVSQSEERAQMTLKFGDGTERNFVIRISEDEPDYWVFVDLSLFQGQNLLISYPEKRNGLKQIYQSSQFAGSDSLYQETFRPGFHFTTKRGWNNDPNGLVYLNGIYHLYYQHNPFEIFWENMHWGHATSRDLIHWEEKGDVLFPDKLGTMYSGSAVVDMTNSSGFQQGKEDVLVAFYTAHKSGHEVQCMAYSNDNGETWTKFKDNPIIDSKEHWNSGNTRDPKVFWHEDSRRWVMVLFEKDGHSIYTSENMKQWIYKSHQTGFWECPELIRLPVDGNPNQVKWVMYGASGTYFIGDFDGEKFSIDSGKHRYFSGSMYAGQTYNNTPGGSKTAIQIGWGQITHPGMPFNQMMTFPTELSLRSTRNGIRLFSKPIAGLEKLYEKSWEWSNVDIAQANENLRTIEGDMLRIKMKVEMIEGTTVDLKLDGNSIATYSFNHNKLNGVFYEGEGIEDKTIDLEILVDKTSVEVFADDGKFSVIADRLLLKDQTGIQFSPRRDQVKIHYLKIHRLKSIWSK